MIEETRHHRMILCGDFNMDQLLQENVNALQRLLQEFNLHQRVTHTFEGGFNPPAFHQYPQLCHPPQLLKMPNPHRYSPGATILLRYIGLVFAPYKPSK